jgi:hypothetical protein
MGDEKKEEKEKVHDLSLGVKKPEKKVIKLPDGTLTEVYADEYGPI